MRKRPIVIAVVGGAALLAGWLAWSRHEVDVELPREGRTLSWTERREVQRIADEAAHDVRAVLPGLPERLTLVVELGKDVIPETGENGTFVPGGVVWTIDPERDVLSIIRTQLRPTLFHELHHLVRARTTRSKTLMDNVVAEGMATAFERDFGKVDPPWGKAPPEALDWTHELLAQPETAPLDHWLIRHPDGRRWVGMRAGTFIVDRASRFSQRSSAALVSTSTDEVLRLAQVR